MSIMIDWKDTMEEMRAHGMKLPYNYPVVNIDNAEAILRNAMTYFVGIERRKFVWINEYSHVSNWLEDNQGKGIFLYGRCGNGKSLLSRFVIPAIILKYSRQVVHVFDMPELVANIDEALKYKLISLDDIGTEKESVVFGNRRDAFCEIIDHAEKYGQLLIVSSNLSKQDIESTYGDRVFDRMKKLMKMIPFNHESFR